MSTNPLIHIDLFSGIGGFALAAQWAGFKTVAFCEIEPYCQAVLRKNFPDIPICADIKDFTSAWLFGKNDGRCATENRWQQTNEILSLQSRQIRKPRSSDHARHAEQNGSFDRAKLSAGKEDFAHGNAVESGCAEPMARTRVADNGCEEEEIRIGNMAEDTIELDATTKTKFPNGDAESLRETIIGVNDARESRKSAVNSTPITSSHGLNSQRNDSTSQTESPYAKNAIDLLTAGPPCQPASQAGKRGGATDDRWLWPETFRVIREFRPKWCLLENVPGILTLNGGLEFEHLLTSLEEAGYSVWPLIIPACAVDAKHRRDRVWIVGHAESGETSWQGQGRLQSLASQSSQDVADAESAELTRSQRTWNGREGFTDCCSWRPETDWFTQSGMGRVAARISNRVDRLKALGNAIVPQVAYEIIKEIAEIEMRDQIQRKIICNW